MYFGGRYVVRGPPYVRDDRINRRWWCLRNAVSSNYEGWLSIRCQGFPAASRTHHILKRSDVPARHMSIFMMYPPINRCPVHVDQSCSTHSQAPWSPKVRYRILSAQCRMTSRVALSLVSALSPSPNRARALSSNSVCVVFFGLEEVPKTL